MKKNLIRGISLDREKVRKIWMTMRLIVLLSFVSLMHLSASVYSQKTRVNLKVENATLQQVFQTIQDQTEFDFFYKNEQIPADARISIQYQDESVEVILDKILSGTGLTYHVLDKDIVISAKGSARSEINGQQQKSVSGKVSDSSRLPLPGVSVVVKGTTTGVITDVNGNYSLSNVPENATLQFSFVGMKAQEIAAAGKTTINVTLIDETVGIEEVVAVGYGTLRKKDLTGAVAMISSEKLGNQALGHIGAMLDGQVAGVVITPDSGDPNADVDIKIRGLGTFGANPKPLVVVDGIITTNGLNGLNPWDVESISVLKDAASAAIYGSRGANGVILVTTKSGKAGIPDIKVNAYYGFEDVPNLIDIVDGSTYGKIINEAANYPMFNNPETFGEGVNWQKLIFQTAKKQSYNISVTGGNEKNLYAIAAEFYSAEGLVRESKVDRGNFRIRNDFKINDKLKIGENVNAIYIRNRSANSFGAIYTALSYPNLFKEIDDTNFESTIGAQPATNQQDLVNPLINILKPRNTSDFIKGLGNVYAEYEFLQGLKFKSNASVEYLNYRGDEFIPEYYYSQANQSVSKLTVNQNSTVNLQWDNILTYNKNFNQKHNVDLMLGYTFNYQNFKSIYGYGSGLISNDESTRYLSSVSTNQAVGGGGSKWAIISYLTRGNYSYKDKYLVGASLRVDQSSRFPKETRTGYFPGVSVGWVASSEDFLKGKLGPISYLKFRGSYGVLGNQDIGVYPYQSTMMRIDGTANSNNNTNYVFGATPSVAIGYALINDANRDITWEKTKTYSAAMEANLFNGKVRFISEYYYKYSSDILLKMPLVATSGFAMRTTAADPNERFAYRNVADVSNKGIELTLEYNNYSDKKPLRVSLGTTFSYNINNVEDIQHDVFLATTYSHLGGGRGCETRIVKGKSINSYYGYVFDGIFQTPEEILASPYQKTGTAPGDIKFKNIDASNNVIDINDRTFIGSSLPDKNVGFFGKLNYKQFDLSFNINGNFGALGSINTLGFSTGRPTELKASMWNDRWIGPGSSYTLPRIANGDPNDNTRYSDFWLVSRDFVKIQNVQLGYNLPKELISKTFKHIRIYLSGQNLYTFTKWPGYDPALTLPNQFPLPRTYFCGVNIGF